MKLKDFFNKFASSYTKYGRMNFIKALMFNRLVKLYMTNSFGVVLDWNKRLKGMAFELTYTLSIFFPLLMLLVIPTMIWGNPNPRAFQWVDLMTLVPFCILLVALLNKDFFGGQSVIKRFLGYQVIDVKTARPASRMKCMVRNMTAVLWPIEVLFTIINPERRLGDFIAGTRVVTTQPSDPELILNEIKAMEVNRQARLVLLFSALWALVFTVLFDPRAGLL